MCNKQHSPTENFTRKMIKKRQKHFSNTTIFSKKANMVKLADCWNGNYPTFSHRKCTFGNTIPFSGHQNAACAKRGAIGRLYRMNNNLFLQNFYNFIFCRYLSVHGGNLINILRIPQSKKNRKKIGKNRKKILFFSYFPISEIGKK